MQNQKKKLKPQKQKLQRSNRRSSSDTGQSSIASQNPENKVLLGYVGKPHGVAGAFFVNGRDEKLPDLKKVFVGKSVDEAVEVAVVKNFVSAGKPVLHIATSTNRDVAENFRRQSIFVSKETLLDVLNVNPTQTFFFNDILGRKVEYQKSDGSIELFGIVKNIYETPSDINVTIENNQKEIDIPLKKDFFDMSFEKTPDKLRLIFAPEDLEEYWVRS